MKYLYLHGLGQKPDSWDRVIKETTVSDRSASLSLAEMLEGKAASYRELYTAFSEECNKEDDEINSLHKNFIINKIHCGIVSPVHRRS